MYCSHGTQQSKKYYSCANLLFQSDQSECYIQASKKDSLFLFFASLNLSTCLFIQLELMVQCQNSNTEKKIQDLLDFNQKSGQNSSCEVGFDIPPLQALNLSPLAQEVDLLPTRAEVYDISWVLHCFDMLHCQTSTSLIDDSSNLNKVMKLLFCE